MFDVTARQTHPASGEIRRAAARLVSHVRRDVLTNPGRRASVRTAVGREPGEPRTFGAIAEVATFLPGTGDDPTVQRAFVAVAAMMCAQPLKAREQDTSGVGAATASEGEEESEEEDAGKGEDATEEERPDPSSAHSKGTPHEPGRMSLGSSCAEAVGRGVSSGNTMELRLHALCRADNTALHRQLPRLIAMLRSGSVGVDWTRLIVDLSRWRRPSQRDVAATWLRDYYRRVNTEERSSDKTDEENA